MSAASTRTGPSKKAAWIFSPFSAIDPRQRTNSPESETSREDVTDDFPDKDDAPVTVDDVNDVDDVDDVTDAGDWNMSSPTAILLSL